MNKKDLAALLKRAADLMEVLGEGEFRVLAYRRAARALEASPEPLEDLAERGFSGVRGIGPSLARLLSEIYETGEFPYLEELEGRLPAGALELFSVQGLGPKKIRRLLEEGITSLEALVEAGETGRLAALPGFGKKSAEKAVAAARFALKSARRVLLPVGLEVAELLLEDLFAHGIEAELAGSLRRGLETVGGVDLVARADPEAVRKALGVHFEREEGGVLHGRVEGMPLKVFPAREENFGTVLLAATGSRAFVEALGALPEAETEAGVFRRLGRPFVPPYFREPEHLGLLPPARPLTRADLKGLLHVHTTYSDGAEPLLAMARAARDEGYAYLLVSDHSQSAAYAGGLDEEKLRRQWAEIDAINAELAPFRVLKGIESEILKDGSLDYPEEILAGFDLVIGSLHSHLDLPEAEQTERLLKAIENPYLAILGHPSGRLLLRREGARADWEAVLEAAVEAGVVVELNASPARLDLDWRLALRFRDRLLFAIGPDAHSREMLGFVELGVLMANKAGIPPERVVNTWEAEDLLRHVRARRR